MKESRVEKLWDGVQDIPNMKRIVLNGSKQLMELPDLSKALSLQELELMGCMNLLSVHPSIFSLPNLVTLTLWNCLRLNNIPEWSEVKKEVLSSASASASSSSSSHTCRSKLQYLNLEGCVSLKNLPDSFSTLTSLKNLDGSGCDRLYQVPNNINNLSLLESLSLRDTNVKTIPETIKHLPHLRKLLLTSCRGLQPLPQIPPSLHKRNSIVKTPSMRCHAPPIAVRVLQLIWLSSDHLLTTPPTYLKSSLRDDSNGPNRVRNRRLMLPESPPEATGFINFKLLLQIVQQPLDHLESTPDLVPRHRSTTPLQNSQKSLDLSLKSTVQITFLIKHDPNP
ncbi:hypothetical protein PIB30_048442 [Stylosanthes scabra]|uniref:Uncharacterized protein n=1 Tax=Stylosanthes scabra TaxID=79078 RepID=A0ABU6WFK3_9FABA|nr:hypothetical protein [Stylosanthes scabra]